MMIGTMMTNDHKNAPHFVLSEPYSSSIAKNAPTKRRLFFSNLTEVGVLLLRFFEVEFSTVSK